MEWTDEGIILSARGYGETSVILEVLTPHHGRHAGLVRGGRSRTRRPMLQIGNQVHLVWRGRLEEHLGNFNVELAKSRAALIMEDAKALSGLTSLAVMCGLLAEREPHFELFEATVLMADMLISEPHWPALMVYWELGLLDELGFGLDLTKCAVTTRDNNLIYVSPKTGRAVCAQIGEPYKHKLLTLPGFLRPTTTDTSSTRNNKNYTPEDLANGFRLTGYFLEKHVFSTRNTPLPEARTRMIGKVTSGV